MKKLLFTISQFGLGLIVFFYSTLIQAASPLWSFKPNTTPVMTISPFETKTVIYTVTNNSFRTHELMIKPTNGITQVNPCASGGNCIAGAYWSSTEGYSAPSTNAWRQTMSSNLASTSQSSPNKSLSLRVRCARLF